MALSVAYMTFTTATYNQRLRIDYIVKPIQVACPLPLEARGASSGESAATSSELTI